MVGFLKSDKPLVIKDNALWLFSIEFYAVEENRASLLFLQEQYALNINIILALLWFSKTGRGICGKTQLNLLLQTIYPWQHLITEALRDLRKQSSKENEHLYQSILDVEIFSEKIQQCLIHDFFFNTCESKISCEKQAKAAMHNLQNYLSLSKVSLSDTAYQHIRNLLSHTFASINDFDFPQISFEFYN